MNIGDSPALDKLSLFMVQWHMPLFTLLCGFSICFALKGQGKTLRRFFTERVRKLLVPFFYALFIIVIPEMYVIMWYHSRVEWSLSEFVNFATSSFWSKFFSMQVEVLVTLFLNS